jgi:hypothetical protein
VSPEVSMKAACVITLPSRRRRAYDDRGIFAWPANGFKPTAATGVIHNIGIRQ